MKKSASIGLPLLLILTAVAGASSPDFISGEEFHRLAMAVYSAEIDWPVNKAADRMARVKYSPSHPNPNFDDSRRGQGDVYATWIFSEQSGTSEGIMNSALTLMMSAEMDPNASVGMHKHYETEEVYYIVEGSLEITTVSANGDRQATATLTAGDAHHITFGESHSAVAGPDGAKILVVEVGR